MKKSLLALAALTAFAGAASAQSSVTLFGILDVAVRGVDNDNGARTTLSTDGNASSRLGFRGVEDLGGGLRAGFWLEAALSPDTGLMGSSAQAVNQIFNRRATVSLTSGLGEIRLGRDYTPTFWNHTVFDPFGTNGVGSQTNLMTQQGQANPQGSAAGTLVRANNTVGYFLPTLGGIYGQLMWAFEDQDPPGQNYIGGRIGYAAGPINVAFAYGETKEAVGNETLEAWNIGASWNFGFMTLMGQYHDYSIGARQTENFLIGGTFPLGNGVLKASYSTTSLDAGGPGLPGSGNVSGDASQIAVGYVYDLSKRTALYGHYSVIDNDPGLRFTASGSGKTNGVGGFTSQGIEFGVRHSF